ncbi:MAG TPA: response regulator [Opitutaceae bacterium]|nr:response regulator [Opitutaceae bacterium]
MTSSPLAFPTGRKILLVDDQPSVLASLDYLFSMHGYSTVRTTRGEEALACAQSETFDAIIVDLHMPGLDGIAVCQRLHAGLSGAGRQTPIWIMTAAFTSEAATRAIEAGARAVLKKPFDCVKLMREIETFATGPAPAPASAPPPSSQAVA